MHVCGGGSSSPVLRPLNSPALPLDSWLLWCEGQQQQQQQQQTPGLSVVLVTVCGRERFVLLSFTRFFAAVLVMAVLLAAAVLRAYMPTEVSSYFCCRWIWRASDATVSSHFTIAIT